MLRSILTSPKTSIVGAISAILAALQLFGLIHLTPEQIGGVSAAAVAVLGLIAKDGDRGATSDPTAGK